MTAASRWPWRVAAVIVFPLPERRFVFECAFSSLLRFEISRAADGRARPQIGRVKWLPGWCFSHSRYLWSAL